MNQIQILVLLEVMAYSMLPNHAQPTIKVCGRELVEALNTICGNRGTYSPPQGFSRQTQATKDGIATQCCGSHGCEYSFLEKFCNPPTSESEVAAPPQGLTSSENERRTNRVSPDSPVPTGNGGSQTPEVDVTSGQLPTTNHSKHPSTELGGEESSQGGAGDVAEGKSDTSPGPSERGESRSLEEDTVSRGRPTNRPTNRPNRHHSRQRVRSRTSKGSDRRSNSSRRKGSREHQSATSAGRRKPKQRGKGQRPRKSNSKKRSRLEKKGSVVGKPSTTPFEAETAHQPNKNGGGYNSTSGDLSLVNVTDTASASETKKDGFFTTITAVLNAIGFQQADDGNR